MIRLLMLFSIVLLTACSAKLNVRVDTLDPDYVKERIAAKDSVTACRQALAETSSTIDAEIAGVAQQLVAHHDLVAKSYRCVAPGLSEAQRAADEEMADEVQISRLDAIAGYELDAYRAARTQKMDAVQYAAARIAPNVSPCKSDQPELFFALSDRRDLIDRRASLIAEQLTRLRTHVESKKSASCPTAPTDLTASPQSDELSANVESNDADAKKQQEIDANVAESEQMVVRKARSFLGSSGSTLSGSPYAYVISSAPESEWQRNFNRALGQGSMGNLDVAIILNETADFSVKGMRFDASKVAEVASKLTSQALHLAVQIAGGPPIATPVTAGTTPSALSQSTTALATAQQQVAVRDALRQSRNLALFDLADTLAANYGLVNANNLATTAASIRARLEAQLALLKLESSTQP